MASNGAALGAAEQQLPQMTTPLTTPGTTNNSTKGYSPVTMDREWPAMARLIMVVVFSTIGTIVNGFFVAAFFVEENLRTKGNVYLACVGLSDLIVTGAVLPISATVILSGQWDSQPVCQVQYMLLICSTYAFSLFFMMTALESYFRLCRTSAKYRRFLNARVGVVSIAIFALSVVVAAVGVYEGQDYDYCERQHLGNVIFRYTTGGLLYICPGLVTAICIVYVYIHVERRAVLHVSYKRSLQYDIDSRMSSLNIWAYMFFVISWTPYIVIVYTFPDTTESLFYNCVLLALMRSIYSSCIYCSASKNFRRAFSHLFYYCCCKSSLSGPYRHRRVLNHSYVHDVRVHIMHQNLNHGRLRRSCLRDTPEL